MKRWISAGLAAVLLVSSQGCATLKNTRVPNAFSDVGVCGHCKKLIALDGLANDDSAVCPECGAQFIVKEARIGFKSRVVARKNQKTAQSFMVVTWLAVSIAGTFYGIPIPPPPLSAETFRPYEVPFSISCRKARRSLELIQSPCDIMMANPYRDLYATAWIANPYNKEMGPYSLIINDYCYEDVSNPYASITKLTGRTLM